MFKKFLCFAVLLCVGVFLCGCSSVKPKDTFKLIKKRGRIVVGVRSDTKPFGFRDINGNLQGFDVDLARAIAKHIFADSSAVELVPVTAADRISKLNTGRVDMLIATFSVTDQRRYIVEFSKPYYLAGQAILVRDNQNIASIKQLNGKKIITVYGSTGEDSVKMNAPEAIIRGYKDYNHAYEAFKNGVADAMIADDTILYNLAIDDPSIRMLEKRFSKEPYAVAFRKEKASEQLIDSVNFTIELLEHSGQLRDMQRKWGIW